MGLLVPFEHATRVDPQRAARVFLALGSEHVHVSTLEVPDVAAIDFVCARLVPDSETWVSIQGGVLAPVLDELEAVVFAGGATCTFVAAEGVHMGVWADGARWHSTTYRDRAAVFAKLRRAAPAAGWQISVTAPNQAALELLPRLLIASGGTVQAYAELPALVAAEIAERGLPCDNWQHDDLMYLPDSQILQTFFVNVIPPAESAAWRAKIDAALMSR
jgi:hypothetical protein